MIPDQLPLSFASSVAMESFRLWPCKVVVRSEIMTAVVNILNGRAVTSFVLMMCVIVDSIIENSLEVRGDFNAI